MSFIKAGTPLLILFLLNCFISHDVMSSPLFISDDEISKILDWFTLIPAVENAMGDLSKKEVIQPPRLVMQLPSKDGVLLAMPAFSKNQEALGCKLVTSFKNNQKKGLPSVLATILFMDSNTGKVKVIMEGSEITTWRTAAASVVATKHLHRGEKKILAILGAGTQGRIHAIAMKHYFNFQEVRIWNRSPERAKKLCDELGSWAKHYTNNEDCVRGADVIVTATYATSPIVLLDWVKNGSHINAIGSGITHHSELEEKLYTEKGTALFVDHIEAAVKELKGLISIGVGIEGEVGEVINNKIQIPKDSQITVFHSLGMAVEDVVAAKLVYESYVKLHNITVQ